MKRVRERKTGAGSLPVPIVVTAAVESREVQAAQNSSTLRVAPCDSQTQDAGADEQHGSREQERDATGVRERLDYYPPSLRCFYGFTLAGLVRYQPLR